MKHLTACASLLLFAILAMSACGSAKVPAIPDTEENTASLDGYALDGVDFDSFTEEESELFLALLHEQGSAYDFTRAEDGSACWRSDTTENQLGGSWRADWCGLPALEGRVVYQTATSYSFDASLEDCDASALPSYCAALANCGFTMQPADGSADTFLSYHGESAEQTIDILYRQQTVFIELWSKSVEKDSCAEE